jgi:hypothetical protein
MNVTIFEHLISYYSLTNLVLCNFSMLLSLMETSIDLGARVPEAFPVRAPDVRPKNSRTIRRLVPIYADHLCLCRGLILIRC